MRQVGKRTEPAVQAEASGRSLFEGAQFSASIAHLSGGSTFVPKGVYRFKSHEDAARQDQEWLAQGMARLAKERKNG